MTTPDVDLRQPNCLDDYKRMAAIYRPYVLKSAISYESTAPTPQEMQRRVLLRIARNLPVLVAVTRDKLREVIGFAFATNWGVRYGYRFMVEDSIYLRDDMQKQGIGGKLLKALLDELIARKYVYVLAVIGDDMNVGSVNLHRRLGFDDLYVLPNMGHKSCSGWVRGRVMFKQLNDFGVADEPNAPIGYETFPDQSDPA